MAIMRHSDRSNLTLGTYAHVQVHNLRRAIENLPDYPWPGSEESNALSEMTVLMDSCSPMGLMSRNDNLQLAETER
ncbi:MAG: hypothetical protein ACYTDW_01580 [Planctomycetota bacterium]